MVGGRGRALCAALLLAGGAVLGVSCSSSNLSPGPSAATLEDGALSSDGRAAVVDAADSPGRSGESPAEQARSGAQGLSPGEKALADAPERVAQEAVEPAVASGGQGDTQVPVASAEDEDGEAAREALMSSGSNGRGVWWWQGTPGALSALPSAAQYAADEPDYQSLLMGRKRPIKGTASVGDVVDGRLYHGEVLPAEGPHFSVIPECRARGTQHGVTELLTLVRDVARAVADAGAGPDMRVCNMSKEGGGNFEWSRSHNSGRDVDLAFFMIDNKTDQPVEAPGLLRFGRSLFSLGQEEPPLYRFDVARNWLLVRSLLTHPTVHVQWIFVYKPLKRAMLRHAKAIGEEASIIEKARLVVLQPSDSSRHHDHFHVRIFCPPSDRPEGCLDEEPLWPWHRFDDRPLVKRAAAIIPGFFDPDVDVRREVLAYVRRIKARYTGVGLAHMAIFDKDMELRNEALNVLAEWRDGDPLVVESLERMIRAPGPGLLKDDPDFTREAASLPLRFELPFQPVALGGDAPRSGVMLSRAYRVLLKIAAPDSAPFLGAALASGRTIGDEGEGVLEARLAAKAALHVMDLRLVPGLLDALTHEHHRVRIAANLALRRVTNHAIRGGWGPGVKPEKLAEQAQTWRQWWEANQHKSRDQLLYEGFRERGVRLGSVASLDNKAYVDALVPMTKRRDEIGYNADRVLVRMTGRFTPREASAEAKHKKWRRWYPEK